MAAASDKNSKTEEPTAKRLQKARQEGQIPRTIELPSAAALVVASYLLPWLVRSSYRRIVALMESLDDVITAIGLRGTATRELDPLIGFFARAMGETALMILPIVATFMILGIVTNALQVGWAFSTKKLKPKPSKLNPMSGLKQLVSPNSFVELIKNVAKVSLITVLVWPACRRVFDTLAGLGRPPVVVLAQVTADACVWVLRSVGWVWFVVAGLDYLWQRKRTRDQLKMTKQEVKDEHKQAEGDPQVKNKIKSKMLTVSYNRIMSATPKADVVIVNPTHLSVALAYDTTTGAPKVLAKGAGHLALRIREIAAEHDLPVVHDKPLARTLFRLVEVDEVIPMELYESVARVLAFVYTLRAKGQSAGWHESPFAARHEQLVELPSRRELLASRR